MLCDYGCGQEAKFQFKNGKWCCESNCAKCSAIRKKIPTWKNGHPKAWLGKKSHMKGKTYEEILGEDRAKEVKRKMSISLKNFHPTGLGRNEEVEKQRREKIRLQIQDRYEKGWLPVCGRAKKISYSSHIAGKVRLDGKWEYGVAIFLDNNNINWLRNKKRFEYLKPDGRIGHYTPDFYLVSDNSYLEVKGYETDLDRCKWSQFKEPLKIWKIEKLISLNILDKVGNVIIQKKVDNLKERCPSLAARGLVANQLSP